MTLIRPPDLPTLDAIKYAKGLDFDFILATIYRHWRTNYTHWSPNSYNPEASYLAGFLYAKTTEKIVETARNWLLHIKQSQPSEFKNLEPEEIGSFIDYVHIVLRSFYPKGDVTDDDVESALKRFFYRHKDIESPVISTTTSVFAYYAEKKLDLEPLLDQICGKWKPVEQIDLTYLSDIVRARSDYQRKVYSGTWLSHILHRQATIEEIDIFFGYIETFDNWFPLMRAHKTDTLDKRIKFNELIFSLNKDKFFSR